LKKMLLFIVICLMTIEPSLAQDKTAEAEDPVIPKRIDLAIAEVMASNFVAWAAARYIREDNYSFLISWQSVQDNLRHGLEWDPNNVKYLINRGYGYFYIEKYDLAFTQIESQMPQLRKSGLPELVEGLRCAESDLRRMAEEPLGLLGAEAVPYVEDVLVSGQKANRRAAAAVLGRILKETQERKAGQALAKRVKSEEDREVRMEVIISLSLWRSEEAVDSLLDALTDPEAGCREFAWREIENVQHLRHKRSAQVARCSRGSALGLQDRPKEGPRVSQ